MRIGLVSHEYPPQHGLGGVGSYMFRLAGALGQTGHEVHVFAGPSDRPPIQQANVHLHRIEAIYQPDSSIRAVRWLYWRGLAPLLNWAHPTIWHWIKWDLASLEVLREFHAQCPLDIIETPEHAANGWMAGHLRACPMILRVHCPWEIFIRINRFPPNPMNRALARLERRTAARFADAVTVPSQAMLREVDHSWKLRRPPVVIPNFIDVPHRPAAAPEGDAPYIVCIGRIEPLKGQDTLVRAFAMVGRAHPRARLALVGPDRWPGERRFAQVLAELAPDPAIRQRIEMPGAVALDQVAQYLRQAHVVVIPSRGFESFSFAALEALASARPVVAANVGALPEIVRHEETGLLVPPDDPHGLADAIERLLEDRRLATALALAGHTRARQQYDTSAVLPRILAAYDQATDFFCSVNAAGSERTAIQRNLARQAAAEAAAEADEAYALARA